MNMINGFKRLHLTPKQRYTASDTRRRYYNISSRNRFEGRSDAFLGVINATEIGFVESIRFITTPNAILGVKN